MEGVQKNNHVSKLTTEAKYKAIQDKDRNTSNYYAKEQDYSYIQE